MQLRVNRTQLIQWSAGDNDEESTAFLMHLVTQFLNHVPNVVQEMTAHREKRDFLAIEKLAHGLKGTAGNLGLMLLQEYCMNLEEQAKESRFEEVGALIRKIDEEVPLTLREFRQTKWTE